MINYPEKAVYTYDDLVDILRILRAPGGCPWDREQTHESNRRNFLEEAYEAAEAFDLDDPELMEEELGDMPLFDEGDDEDDFSGKELFSDEDMDDFGDDDLGDKFKLFDEDDDEDKD